MENTNIEIDAVENEPAKRRKACKPLTSRLKRTKNFHKVDRELDNYIDQTSLIKGGPKRLLKKMLLLRSREDSNEVKVTVSGLSLLLDVDKKTIRDWLKQLESKAFIYYQGEVWDPHCNYPKKKFVFAHTFPGFDHGAVFIQKGAKAKRKAKMAEIAAKQAAVKGRIAKQKAGQITCPVSPTLLDCSTPFSRGTRNKKEEEETIVSSSPSPSPFLISVRSPKLRCAKPASGSKVKTESSQARTPKTVMDCSAQLKSLLVTILAQAKASGKTPWVSNFIDQCVRENGSINTWADLHELADDLCFVIPQQFSAKRGKTLLSLFQFLREYIGNYVGRSTYRSSRYNPHYRSYEWECARQEFFRRYPICLPHPITGRETGVNR